MTSQINPNNIDGTYPVAGVPNNTQGMRDNFTATKTNFQYAADEINDLQSKAVLKSALTGGTLDNNMNDNLLYAVKLNDVSYTYLQNTATSGSITVDYSAGPFQQITTSGSVSLSFTNWPSSGSVGVVHVAFNITNTAHTITLPAAVSQGISSIAGSSPGTPGVSNTITFGAVGNYAFQFLTSDGGATVWIFDDSRPPDLFTANLTISNTRVSTSPTTGALVVLGGTGINGNLNVGGNLQTYTSGGNIAFSAADNGFITIYAPTVPALTNGALNIIGSSTGGYQNVINTGSMLHITGNDNTAARTTIDTFGSAANAYPILTQRRARGTAAAPTAVQSGDTLARITASGYGNVGYALATGNVAATSIDFIATENYTSANAGSSINFYTSPIGAVTKTLSGTITANVTTFPAIVSVTGNITTPANILLSDGGTMGYNSGSGGTVSQSGNKSGGVTLNKPSGEITMQNTSLAANTPVNFTLTNSTINAKDLLLINIVGGQATPGSYYVGANCTTGSAVICVRNLTAGSLSEAIVLRYAVIRGSTT